MQLTRRLRLLASRVALLGLATAVCVPAMAVDSFIQNKAEGWFWYEREPEVVETPELPEPPPVSIVVRPEVQEQMQGPKPFSVQWFQEEYMGVLNAAIENPTAANVQKYRYATRVMLDKASNFTHVFQQESLLDPLLDESVRMPFASYARSSYERLTATERKRAAEFIARKAGLWVFLDDTCAFCAMQYPLVARTAKDRGYVVTYITPDGKRPEWMDAADDVRMDQGQSKYLRIGVRPAIALVIPPDRVTVVAQGMLSQDMLEERLLFAADHQGLLPPALVAQAFPERRGLLTPEDIDALGQGLIDNPDGLTEDVQRALQKRY